MISEPMKPRDPSLVSDSEEFTSTCVEMIASTKIIDREKKDNLMLTVRPSQLNGDNDRVELAVADVLIKKLLYLTTEEALKIEFLLGILDFIAESFYDLSSASVLSRHSC